MLPPRHESHHARQLSYVRRLMGRPTPDQNQDNPYL